MASVNDNAKSLKHDFVDEGVGAQKVMEEMERQFETRITIFGKRHIECPYCMHVQGEETVHEHVTYWGSSDTGNKHEHCESCDKDFVVEEVVARRWNTFGIEDVE